MVLNASIVNLSRYQIKRLDIPVGINLEILVSNLRQGYGYRGLLCLQPELNLSKRSKMPLMKLELRYHSHTGQCILAKIKEDELSFQIFPRIRASVIAFSFILLVLVFIFISLNIFGTAFRKLGFPPEYSVYFLFLSLPCSYLNIPIKTYTTTIAINLGGAVIPIIMSLFLLSVANSVKVLSGILLITIIIHKIAACERFWDHCPCAASSASSGFCGNYYISSKCAYYRLHIGHFWMYSATGIDSIKKTKHEQIFVLLMSFSQCLIHPDIYIFSTNKIM